MPSLKSRAVPLPQNYGPARGVVADPAAPGMVQAFAPDLPTVTPGYLTRSPFMVTSLPGLSTSLDGGPRQFFNSRALPVRRVALPR